MHLEDPHRHVAGVGGVHRGKLVKRQGAVGVGVIGFQFGGDPGGDFGRIKAAVLIGVEILHGIAVRPHHAAPHHAAHHATMATMAAHHALLGNHWHGDCGKPQGCHRTKRKKS